MARALISMLSMAAVFMPGVLFAAETMKLRPLAPIYVDTKGGGMRQPEGVWCGTKPVLVVADTGNGRLLAYEISGDTTVSKAEFALPQLPYPIKVQVDSKGEMLALDGKSRRIVRVSPSGEFKGYVEPSGVAGTVVPRSFRVDGEDALHILDVFGRRLITADLSGKARQEIPFPKGAAFLSDLAVDRKGNVFLVDSLGKRVFAAKKGSTEIVPFTEVFGEDVNFPTSVAVDEKGMVFVGDQNGGGVVVFGPDGSFRGRQLAMGWKDAFLRYPSDLCHNGGGALYVADRENNRVQSFVVTQ